MCSYAAITLSRACMILPTILSAVMRTCSVLLSHLRYFHPVCLGFCAYRVMALSPSSPLRFQILKEASWAPKTPLHTEQRKVLSAVFNRRVKQLETQLEQYCADLVNRLPRNETFDFMHHCARDVPSWAICTLLGMPLSMQSQLAQWAHLVIKLMLGNTNDEGFVGSAEAGLALQIYLHEFFDDAEKNPPDNLTGDLAMLVRMESYSRALR